MTQTVKLAKLKRSEKNVRTTPPKNIEAMAASIRARGIMQNLLVTAARPKGMFEIIAGDRRYLGAMMLADALRQDRGARAGHRERYGGRGYR